MSTSDAHRVLLLFLAFFTLVCGDPVPNYYAELGCNLVKGPSGSDRYNCSILDQLREDKCFYDNKVYNTDTTIKDEVVRDKCIVECTCIQMYQSNKNRWSCVDIECPELFHPQPECKRLYTDHTKCCSTKKVCPQDPVPEGTCEYAGKTYLYGEKFYPNDEKCKTCICGEGFNGTLSEPWCKTFSCNLYLHYLHYIRDGCLPTYYETDSCCPIPVWRCPKESDTVITPKNVEVKDKENVCEFGKLKLAVGQMLSPSTESDSKSVDCKCLVPPHLTCLMNKSED